MSKAHKTLAKSEEAKVECFAQNGSICCTSMSRKCAGEGHQVEEHSDQVGNGTPPAGKNLSAGTSGCGLSLSTVTNGR